MSNPITSPIQSMKEAFQLGYRVEGYFAGIILALGSLLLSFIFSPIIIFSILPYRLSKKLVGESFWKRLLVGTAIAVALGALSVFVLPYIAPVLGFIAGLGIIGKAIAVMVGTQLAFQTGGAAVSMLPASSLPHFLSMSSGALLQNVVSFITGLHGVMGSIIHFFMEHAVAAAAFCTGAAYFGSTVALKIASKIGSAMKSCFNYFFPNRDDSKKNDSLDDDEDPNSGPSGPSSTAGIQIEMSEARRKSLMAQHRANSEKLGDTIPLLEEEKKPVANVIDRKASQSSRLSFNPGAKSKENQDSEATKKARPSLLGRALSRATNS